MAGPARFAIEYSGYIIPVRFRRRESAEKWARWNYKGGDDWRVVDVNGPPVGGKKSRRVMLNCSRALAYCRSIGWPDSEMEALEKLWWQFHDDQGNLRDAHRR